MYGTVWRITFLSLTKVGLTSVIKVKVNNNACVDDMRILIKVKYSRELSANLNTSTAVVRNPIAKYALDNTFRDTR